MAEIRSIYTDKRKTSNRNQQAYINGTAVRKLRKEEISERNKSPKVRHRTVERTNFLSIGYTLFLAAASVLALWVCAGYLQLQADNTARAKQITALEEELADLKTENDDEYNRVTTAVDLEEIRRIAIEELGMVYAKADQVVLYDGEGKDYVKQYAEIPEEEKNLRGLLGTMSR